MSPRLRITALIFGAGTAVAAIAIVAFLLAPTGTPRDRSRGDSPTTSASQGSEVLPPTATYAPSRLGATGRPLVSRPLPESASAEGRLVDGFPSSIGLPTGATVVSSSVSSEASRLQAALVATAPGSSTAVTDFYTNALTALGMTSAPAPASPGSSAITFYRGRDSITLTATAGPTGTRFSIIGLLTAG